MPRRVVSVNLCTDQLLVLLAAPGQIAGISFLATDPDLSHVADRIDGLPVVSGRAEEILAIEPDLVLAGPHGAAQTLRIVEANDIPVFRIGLDSDFDGIRTSTLAVGRVLGREAQARSLIDAMDRRLQALAEEADVQRRRQGGGASSALPLQAQGFTAGAGTLMDAVITAAGLENAAASAGLIGYGYLGLEKVVAAAPDFVIGAVGGAARDADPQASVAPSLAHQMLRHRALQSLTQTGGTRAVTLPAGATACGGPFTTDAVAALVAAAGTTPDAEARR